MISTRDAVERGGALRDVLHPHPPLANQQNGRDGPRRIELERRALR